MTNRKSIHLIVILLLLAGCAGGNVEEASEVERVDNPAWSALQSSESPPIVFEEVQRFGSSEFEGGTVIYSAPRFYEMNVDEDQNLYMIDNRDHKLLAFHPNGEIKWKVGNRGQGPGDIHDASGLGIYENRIFISNNNGSRIDEFDMDGNFVQTFNLDDIRKVNLILSGITESGKVILSTFIPLKIGTHVFVLDISKQMALENDFEVNFGGMEFLTSSWVSTIVDGNEIVIRNGLDFGFTYYNVEGNKVKEVRRDLDTFVRPGNYQGSETERAFIPMSGAFGPYRISDSLLIERISWPTNVNDPDEVAKEIAVNRKTPNIETERVIDFHRSDGKLLYSIKQSETEEFPNLRFADGMGHFYTVSTNPYLHIKKYRVGVVK